ncbi:hypothetical protein CPB86DRAFT_416551 [Serendipita vermifera]|nr:hypothetical protein CPB86DRAFT_416551 [Serendipita vermifera]
MNQIATPSQINQSRKGPPETPSSGPNPGTVQDYEYPPSWIELQQIKNRDRINSLALEANMPASESPLVIKTKAGYEQALADNMNLPKVSTTKELRDLLKKRLFICQLHWKVSQGRLRWVDLHGPCRRAYKGRDNWVRHFKDFHLGKPRAE